MSQPTTLEPTRASVIKAHLALRTGGCHALSVRHSSGHCACDLFVTRGYADGFETCECGHTRWSHAPL